MRGILQAVLFMAIALGLYLEHNDWPAVYHHDEPGKVAQLQRGERNLNHPLLLLEVTDVVRRVSGVSRVDDVGIVACGRAVSAFCMAVAIGMLSLAATNRLGLLAGFAVGIVCVLYFRFYEVGHYFKEDTPYLLGVASVLWALTTTKHTAVCMGLAIGIAAASKYAGISLLVVGWLVTTEKRKLISSTLAVLTLVHLRLLMIDNPFGVLADSLMREASWLIHGHKGIGSSLPNIGYFWRLIYELGIHGLVLLGLWGLSWKRLSRSDYVVLSYIGVYFVVLLCTRKYSERYLLPVMMIALYYVGLQVAMLVRRVPARFRWGKLGVAVVLFASIVVPWYPWLVSHRNAFGGDSRSGLCQYIAEEMPAAAVIVADAAAEIEAAQRWRGDRASKIEAAEYAPSLGSLEDLRARGVTHVVICYDTYHRFLVGGATVDPSRMEEWTAALKFYRRLKTETPLWCAAPRDPKPLHPGLELYAMPGKL
jgi:hypothetical protein